MYITSDLDIRLLTAQEKRNRDFMEKFYHLDSAARSGNGEMSEKAYEQATILGSVSAAIVFEKELIGTIMLDEYPFRGVQWLESLAVHPDYRSAGVGRAAMGFVEAFTRERGGDEVQLNAQSNPQTISFFQRNGFVRLPSRDSTFVLMSKVL